MSGKQTKTTTTTTNNWELTQYEEQRKLHEVRFVDTMVDVSRSLNQDFICPICLELLRNIASNQKNATIDFVRYALISKFQLIYANQNGVIYI